MTTPSANVRDTPPEAGARRWAVLAICCVAAALLGIDNSVLNYAVPSLARQLHPSATQLLWIVDVYGLVLGALLIVAGHLGDRVGRKKLLLIGVAGFGAASALTAYAPDAETLIAARALLGLAGATIMPSTLSLVRSTFTDSRERTTAVGVSGGVGAASFALGPVVGGLLLDHFWWGSVFLINVPVMALVLIAGALILPESRNPHPGRLDLVSVPLSVVGLFAVIWAVKTGARDGVHDPAVWPVAALGAAALTAFLRRQTRLAEPLLELRLFRSPAFSGAITANTVALFTSSTLSLGCSLYFQVVRGWSPLTAGLALLPGPLSAAFAAPLATALITRIGRARTVALGLLLMAGSTAGLGMVTPHTDYWRLLPVLIVNGVGLIFVFAITSDTVLATAPRSRTGAAAAISETAMELGGALGIAILGSVLGAVYRADMTLPAGLSGEQAAAARESVTGGVQVAGNLPGATGQQVADAARHAFTAGLHTTTLIAAAVMALGAFAALRTLRTVPAVLAEPDLPDRTSAGQQVA
ncbi:MFS transporter, DHA2 family, multidrug resistance protein [Streptomyces sp. DvalAA-14]|uniref:MFS transporter n=1 Tax=unclassified Streptomyces TaxID=2593676 RepID=UPI00081BA48D|nr:MULTISPECIES: MFS transporter [unclassified Streptomyces]MYS21203.1 MFS transporter [Streptomyces sp. SID4948]SCD86808.1 MFS transporter, DHA2 family, multidrug resistance protein [Streptomyces sp. DvalAA-14]